ncbi:hypothetical protein LTR62_002293 [Meristemomyces frigidus]|uniref:J domain-containing protein n=1 Tax=Meristemomyces frigidus TaxID=1508187 RepID=A0AAN7TT63_9PEZI|nr:hypothetical protein LTR62_002293 [Meristemomyces frigidus]
MGASQSSTDGGGAGGEQSVKTGYYELLGVERHATEEELKKAYRKKALQLHPDRNHGDEERATTVFAEVQAAYEVLSDPQERAWYDAHESAILRGQEVGDDAVVPSFENVAVTSAHDLARIIGKFNKKVQFSDAPSGFFGFLRETFAQLAQEEQIASRMNNAVYPDYPSFGHEDDTHDDVVRHFYAAWGSFYTVKDFGWKDRYRVSEAPDRWTRRRMEEENKKFRLEGIREFNDAVRSLVAFVRKRDPRYVPSTQTEEERQKVLRDAAAAQAARARAENEAKLNAEVPEWAQSHEPDPLAGMEGTFDEESEEEHVIECVACNKIFKSKNQWETHERSKKHQKAVYTLQYKMRKDNANLDLSTENSGAATPEVDEDDDELLDDITAELDDHEIRNGNGGPGSTNIENEKAVIDNDVQPSNADASDLHTQASQATGVSQDEPAAKELSGEQSDSSDDDYASPEAIQARLAGTTLQNDADINDSGPPSEAAKLAKSEDVSDAPSGKKMGAAAKKRAKKAAAVANDEQTETSHKCAGCDRTYATKTRLFEHLKDNPKHAALKPGSIGGSKKKGRGKK